MAETEAFRCGFAALLGRPNVGKSTLINRVLDRKIAITSKKPQTTRNRILGVYHAPGVQAIFLDTPGLHVPKKPLNQRMVREARSAAAEADVAVMIVEADHPWLDEDLLTLELIESLAVPRVLAINKVDLIAKERLLPLIDHSARLAVFAEIVPLSAKTGDNVDRFLQVIAGLLPEGPALFPPDAITDQAESFWVAELVREKVVRLTHAELPYATKVAVESFEDADNLIRIKAMIMVERDSQKGIVIGKAGAKLKEIGTAARLELERFLAKKVYLELFVRVEKKWRDAIDQS